MNNPHLLCYHGGNYSSKDPFQEYCNSSKKQDSTSSSDTMAIVSQEEAQTSNTNGISSYVPYIAGVVVVLIIVALKSKIRK